MTAPEQAAGDPDVDFRADLYAFGVMAYELLAGQHPFAGKRTMHALVAAHLTEQPKPLTTHASDVTASLSTIVMQCLGKDPAERPESASAIVRALEGVSTPNADSTTPVTRPAAKAIPGIAILPFTNMSGEAYQLLWGQLKLYLRPDWPEAGSHLERAGHRP